MTITVFPPLIVAFVDESDRFWISGQADGSAEVDADDEPPWEYVRIIEDLVAKGRTRVSLDEIRGILRNRERGPRP